MLIQERDTFIFFVSDHHSGLCSYPACLAYLLHSCHLSNSLLHPYLIRPCGTHHHLTNHHYSTVQQCYQLPCRRVVNVTSMFSVE